MSSTVAGPPLPQPLEFFTPATPASSLSFAALTFCS